MLIHPPCRVVAALAVLLSLGAGLLLADDADWATYNHDAQRSGVSRSVLQAEELEQVWEYTSPARLQPAWPGPAPRDMYNSPDVDNADRLDLDSVFHIAAVGDRVFLPSSIEDSLRCLDAADGSELWVFTADGPVRFAPHVVDGRVYFGADDGKVRCLDAETGGLLWETRIAPSDYLVPSDGKMVSLWPNRSGVVVVDGTVHCAAGVFPSEGVYVWALDADTGEPCEGSPARHEDMSLQGHVLASGSYLYFPGGRGGPWVFDRSTGERRGQVGGGGGTYALITGDDTLIYGPGRNRPVLEQFRGDTRDRLAAYPGATHMVIDGDQAFISTEEAVFALDYARYIELSGRLAELQGKLRDTPEGSAERAAVEEAISSATEERDSCETWRCHAALPHGLIVAGDHAIAGGAGEVAALRTADGEIVWRAEAEGRAKGLAAAGGRLFVSTDASRLYCFAVP